MASVKVILNKQKPKKDGSFPIVLQVIKDRKRKLIWLGHSARPEQWDEKKNLPKSSHPNSSRLKGYINSKISQTYAIILDFENLGKPFSVDDIVAKLTSDEKSEFLIPFTQKEISRMIQRGQKGNAAVYQNTLSVFKDFTEGKDIAFKHMDQKLLYRFQDYLLAKGNKQNTVSIHMRTLRAIFNRAIRERAVSENLYPFKSFKIKVHPTEKRAISKEDIDKIRDVDLRGKQDLEWARNLFMFSFYMRGMSFIDIAFLKVGDIQDGRIKYTRRKTGQMFSIRITESAMEIIRKYNDLKDKKSYVFPILYRPDQEYLDYKNAMRLINKKLKKLSKEIELDHTLTTYTCRHSWATIAKRMGISTAIISEGLGHDSEETTQIYLDSFEDSVLDDANELITG